MSFQELMSKNVDEVERPRPLPDGTYEWVITDWEQGESDRKRTPYVQFTLRCTGHGSDVDQDELATALNGRPLSEKVMRDSFYVTEKALYRLGVFLEKAGCTVGGRSFNEVIPEAKGQSIRAYLRTKMNPNDPESSYNEIGAYSEVE